WNMRKTPSFRMLFSIIKWSGGKFKGKNKAAEIFSTAWMSLDDILFSMKKRQGFSQVVSPSRLVT
ncbi:hypothetical protein, partial [Bacillus pumilus]|uniref:hypothetical protein n=1 Tax=Bacillus pumilus TaxID=1408 RepID=UPI0039E8866C